MRAGFFVLSSEGGATSTSLHMRAGIPDLCMCQVAQPDRQPVQQVNSCQFDVARDNETGLRVS